MLFVLVALFSFVFVSGVKADQLISLLTVERSQVFVLPGNDTLSKIRKLSRLENAEVPLKNERHKLRTDQAKADVIEYRTSWLQGSVPIIACFIVVGLILIISAILDPGKIIRKHFQKWHDRDSD